MPAVADLDVEVLNRQRGHRVDTEALARFLRRVAREAPPRRESQLTVCLVSDKSMRETNAAYRNIDRPTDVLAFPTDGDGPPIPGERPHLGDVLIAVPTAARQAAEAGRTLPRELKTLVLHGYLHLLGFDHETDDGLMLRFQDRLEARLFPRRGAAR